MRETYAQRIDDLSLSFSDKQNSKFIKALAREDIKDLESLSENRSIDQIKAATTINTSHNNLLQEIKRKSSTISVNKKELSSTDQLDDTMNLFD